MKMIFIVKGWTGEYSDRTEWPVAAYEDEKMAVEHAQLATNRAKELYVTFHANEDYYGKNEYDPQMDMDANGTDYYVEIVELFKDLIHFKLVQ